MRMESLDEQRRRNEIHVHPERVRAYNEMKARQKREGNWYDAIGPIILTIIVVTVICALYANVMMLD